MDNKEQELTWEDIKKKASESFFLNYIWWAVLFPIVILAFNLFLYKLTIAPFVMRLETALLGAVVVLAIENRIRHNRLIRILSNLKGTDHADRNKN